MTARNLGLQTNKQTIFNNKANANHTKTEQNKINKNIFLLFLFLRLEIN